MENCHRLTWKLGRCFNRGLRGVMHQHNFLYESKNSILNKLGQDACPTKMIKINQCNAIENASFTNYTSFIPSEVLFYSCLVWQNDFHGGLDVVSIDSTTTKITFNVNMKHKLNSIFFYHRVRTQRRRKSQHYEGVDDLFDHISFSFFSFSVFFQFRTPTDKSKEEAEVEQVYRTRQHFVCSAKSDTTTQGKLGRAVGFDTTGLYRVLHYCRFPVSIYLF